MSAQYSRDNCKIAVGKILQTIGWHSINSTPLEVLTDIMSKYIQQISKVTMDYTNEFGNTDPNLDHLGLTFQEMGITLTELEEYVTYVNFGPGPNPIPKFPIPKEDNLNFLKPGSKEVVTRPVHIHEHLPPMRPLLEGNDNEEEDLKIKQEIIEESNIDVGNQQFKKPADISPEFRRPKREDEGSRPTREISSVMMTTSGFLSPAREGKLPEAKAPAPPPPPEPPALPPPPTGDNTLKKKEKRKEKIGKELFKPIPEEKVVKKVPTMKDFVKMKQKVAASNAATALAAATAAGSPGIITPTIPPILATPNLVQQHPPPITDIKLNISNVQKSVKEKMDKALAAAKAKTEKLNTTITPIPVLPPSVTFQPVEKLFNEPDKKKINIFKKISNVKEGKIKKDSRANTPSMMMEEDIVNKIALSRDITIEPINPLIMHKSDKFDYFDDNTVHQLGMHRPQDLFHQVMPPQKEKRKRKDNNRKIKKPKKNHNYMGADIIDLAMMEGRKTPDSIMPMPGRHHQSPHMGLPSMHSNHLPFPFLANFPGPGLIPPPLGSPLSTPLFPFSHIGTFGKNPYFPPMVQNIPPQVEPVSLVSPKVKDPVEIKPLEITPKLSPKPAPSPKRTASPKASLPPKVIPSPKATPRPPTPKVSPPKPVPSPKTTPPIQFPETCPIAPSVATQPTLSPAAVTPKEIISPEIEIKDKKIKEHKKEKKDKLKKKNKKDKIKEKSEKKKLKELKKDNKEKVKKEKKVKKKEIKELKEVIEPENPIPKILLKVNSPSPRPETPESIKKLNIKPIVRKDEELLVEENKREPSPGGLAKIAALVTGPPKPKTNLSPVIPPPTVEKPPEETQVPVVQKPPAKPKLTPVKLKPHKPKKAEQTFKKVDEQGNVVWICPPCGQQDDGRPMIGCDGCDAWYHWVCVGIQVPPDESENWYCKPCLCKKNEDLQSDKKRKRKRKEKKDQ